MLGRLLTNLGRDISGLFADVTYDHEDGEMMPILPLPITEYDAEDEPESSKPAEPFPGWDAMILALLA